MSRMLLRLWITFDSKKRPSGGYSDGCRVGFCLASKHPDRITCLVASGNCGEWDPRVETESLITSLRTKGTLALIQELEEWERFRIPEPLRSNLLATPDAETFALNEEAWLNFNELDDPLVPPAFHTPTLFINGEKEDPERRAEKLATRIPRSKAVTLNGLGHLGAYVRNDLFVQTAIEFLRATA